MSAGGPGRRAPGCSGGAARPHLRHWRGGGGGSADGPTAAESPTPPYKCVFKALAGPGRCLLSPKPAVLLWTQSREQGGPFLELSSSAALWDGSSRNGLLAFQLYGEACWKLTNDCLDVGFFFFFKSTLAKSRVFLEIAGVPPGRVV